MADESELKQNKSQNNLFFIFLLDRQRVFTVLMKNNADVNIKNDLGESVLFFVARFGGKYKQHII